ncbi:MAG: hypothetical protein LBU32_22620 [Clostridiales bacterium]|nr:hypothetical protein [Clostridiales bacterium]
MTSLSLKRLRCPRISCRRSGAFAPAPDSAAFSSLQAAACGYTAKNTRIRNGLEKDHAASSPCLKAGVSAA